MPKGIFDLTANPLGWFDETEKPEGWFSREFLEGGSAPTGGVPEKVPVGRSALVVGAILVAAWAGPQLSSQKFRVLNEEGAAVVQVQPPKNVDHQVSRNAAWQVKWDTQRRPKVIVSVDKPPVRSKVPSVDSWKVTWDAQRATQGLPWLYEVPSAADDPPFRLQGYPSTVEKWITTKFNSYSSSVYTSPVSEPPRLKRQDLTKHWPTGWSIPQAGNKLPTKDITVVESVPKGRITPDVEVWRTTWNIQKAPQFSWPSPVVIVNDPPNKLQVLPASLSYWETTWGVQTRPKLWWPEPLFDNPLGEVLTHGEPSNLTGLATATRFTETAVTGTHTADLIKITSMNGGTRVQINAYVKLGNGPINQFTLRFISRNLALSTTGDLTFSFRVGDIPYAYDYGYVYISNATPITGYTTDLGGNRVVVSCTFDIGDSSNETLKIVAGGWEAATYNYTGSTDTYYWFEIPVINVTPRPITYKNNSLQIISSSWDKLTTWGTQFSPKNIWLPLITSDDPPVKRQVYPSSINSWQVTWSSQSSPKFVWSTLVPQIDNPPIKVIQPTTIREQWIQKSLWTVPQRLPTVTESDIIIGTPVTFLSGVSRIPGTLQGVSFRRPVFTPTGGGNYTITYESGVSGNKSDSASNEEYIT